MFEFRCPRCKRLLARGRITAGSIEVACGRAKCAKVSRISPHGVFLLEGKEFPE